MHPRDKIEKHLIQQKARAVQIDPDPSKSRCQYRTDSGLMCAAGCLIPDEMYNPEIEGRNVPCVLRDFPGILPEGIHSRELLQWQSYHDNFAVAGFATFSYKRWLEGDQDHHPSKFKVEMELFATTIEQDSNYALR